MYVPVECTLFIITHSSHWTLIGIRIGLISFCYTNNEKIQYSTMHIHLWGSVHYVHKHSKYNVHIIHMHHQDRQKKQHSNENRFLNFSTWNNNGKVNQSQANWFATLIRFFLLLFESYIILVYENFPCSAWILIKGFGMLLCSFQLD